MVARRSPQGMQKAAFCAIASPQGQDTVLKIGLSLRGANDVGKADLCRVARQSQPSVPTPLSGDESRADEH